MMKIFFVLMVSLCVSTLSFASPGKVLFNLDIPDNWRQEEIEGGVVFLPPFPQTRGIVVTIKSTPELTDQATIDSQIEKHILTIMKYNIEEGGGSVLENKAILLDGVPAKFLSYTVTIGEDSTYFLRIVLVKDGYWYSIDYESASQSEFREVYSIVETIQF